MFPWKRGSSKHTVKQQTDQLCACSGRGFENSKCYETGHLFLGTDEISFDGHGYFKNFHLVLATKVQTSSTVNVFNFYNWQKGVTFIIMSLVWVHRHL